MLLTVSPAEQPQGPAQTALSRHTGSPPRGDRHSGAGLLVSRHTQQKARQKAVLSVELSPKRGLTRGREDRQGGKKNKGFGQKQV